MAVYAETDDDNIRMANRLWHPVYEFQDINTKGPRISHTVVLYLH